jgi:hypothetical protein
LITCFLRYTIDPDKLAEFEHYASVLMHLIEKYGGTHHGYFVPGAGPSSVAFSFPGIGDEGPENVAVALFSFLPSQRMNPTAARSRMIPSVSPSRAIMNRRSALLNTNACLCELCRGRREPNSEVCH